MSARAVQQRYALCEVILLSPHTAVTIRGQRRQEAKRRQSNGVVTRYRQVGALRLYKPRDRRHTSFRHTRRCRHHAAPARSGVATYGGVV